MSIYLPRFKSKSFLPNPVAKTGIPDFANSSKNPKVIGSKAHTDWWNEQIHYMINGYETGGIYIPGRYYKFLNFGYVSSPGLGSHRPIYTDTHLQLAEHVEHVKKIGKGLIIPKARRKGLSEFMVNAVIDYGLSFGSGKMGTGYKAMVCAGEQIYTDGFRSKLKKLQTLKVPELSLRFSTDNENELIAGWETQDMNGAWKDDGSLNTIFFATMFKSADKAKGEYLDDQIFEECGEFELLIKAYNASEACWKYGSKYVGTPFFFGTGGNVNKGSKGFRAMCADPDAFNCEKLVILGPRMYLDFVGGAYHPAFGKISKLESFPDKQPYELIGVEDVAAAEKEIKEKSKILAKKPDPRLYYEHLQNFPLKEADIFLKFNTNNFPTKILNEQNDEILGNKFKYRPYELDWVRDPKGKPVVPLRVKYREMTELMESEWDNEVLILRLPEVDEEGNYKYENLDVAGIDSYDQDKSTTSKSLGAMVVIRQDHDFLNLESMLPIAVYCARPEYKELFYEKSLMIAVMYNLKYNCLIDYQRPMIAAWWKNFHNGYQYIAARPTILDVGKSSQTDAEGFYQTAKSKPKFLGLVDKFFRRHAKKIWFAIIIKHGLDYDEVEDDSDNDTLDALGLGLLQIEEMGILPTENDSKAINDRGIHTYWEEDNFGRMVNKTVMESETYKEIEDPFIRNLLSGRV